MYAHITWHTWMRVGCVDGPAALEVRTAVASAGKKTGVQVLRGAVLADHVHLVVSFRPDTRLSDFVRLAKSVAATRANRRVVGAVKWARGYYVATIHKRDLARALRYVDRQFQRHPDLIPRSSGLTDPGRKPGEHPNSTGDLTDPGRKPGEHPNSTGDSLTPGASPG
jgi:putative transposase